MAKILVLNGSSRKNGNTAKLSNALITRSIQRGNQVEKFNIFDLIIAPCNACGKCYKKKDVPCTIDDDFNKLVESIISADVIVFSAPVYFYSIPGALKNLIDRMYAFVVGSIDLSNKRYAIISSCAEEDMTSFDGLRIPIEKTANAFGWTLIDEVLAPNMINKSDIENTDGIKRVRDLADKI